MQDLSYEKNSLKTLQNLIQFRMEYKLFVKAKSPEIVKVFHITVKKTRVRERDTHTHQEIQAFYIFSNL